MTGLIESPRLVWPTVTVCESYLAGELADCLAEGTSTKWLGPAGDDFDDFVAQRRGTRIRWDVPSTTFWYVSGEHYIGTLVVRHRLTPELAEVGAMSATTSSPHGAGRDTRRGCSRPGWRNAKSSVSAGSW
jgi:hypothetical protein